MVVASVVLSPITPKLVLYRHVFKMSHISGKYGVDLIVFCRVSIFLVGGRREGWVSGRPTTSGSAARGSVVYAK